MLSKGETKLDELLPNIQFCTLGARLNKINIGSFSGILQKMVVVFRTHNSHN